MSKRLAPGAEKPLCSVSICLRQATRRGFCQKHYRPFMKYGSPTAVNLRYHGLSRTPEYRAWINMIERCEYQAGHEFEYYGGRGISVCREWRGSFATFLAAVGVRPTPKHSLDRFPDVNGNYEPGNVRWATAQQQMRNVRNNRMVVVGGVEMPLAAAIERSTLKYNTVLYRLRRGWPIDQALTLPKQQGVKP